MAVLGKLVTGVLGGALSAFGIGGGKAPAAQPLPAVTRDDAAVEAERMNKIRKRRGAAADMIVNGSSGADAAVSAPRLIAGS